MDIRFRPCQNSLQAAKITFINMQSYYVRYSVDWDVQDIVDKTADLENFDIVFQNIVIGVMRLQYEEHFCYLRDLQVSSTFQNRGIGKVALSEAKRLCLDSGIDTLKLKVFKISPAVNLYKRNGFLIKSDDERFFNMEAEIS